MKKCQKDKCQELKKMLDSNKLEFLMEAHSGLSAIIAEEVGFKGLWASGLSMSAMTGCRDRNELDLTEVCKIVEWMSDHTSIPILVDGDTGGVDVNSARIMVNKLTKAGAAGVCIEDKQFPKHNSFLENGEDDLADPETHAGKIRAMKDENPDFVVIARLEEFISGKGLDEAYRRALIFQSAGADAILVHSKVNNCSEIRDFMEKWNQDKLDGLSRVPIVIVPTKYYTTPTEEFSRLGVSLVIWANHNLRASINAMKEVSRKIYEDESLVNIEDGICTVSEVFRLQKDHEAEEMEKQWINRSTQGSAIILSGSDVQDSSGKFYPKSLCYIAPGTSSTFLNYQKSLYQSRGINNLKVVISSRHSKKGISEACGLNDSQVVISDFTGTEVTSLHKGFDQVILSTSDMLPLYVSYGDITFKSTVFDRLSSVKDSDVVFAVETNPNLRRYNEFVSFKELIERTVTLSSEIERVSSNLPTPYSMIGMFKVNTSKGLAQLNSAILSSNQSARMEEVINNLIKSDCSVKGVLVSSLDWADHD